MVKGGGSAHDRRSLNLDHQDRFVGQAYLRTDPRAPVGLRPDSQSPSISPEKPCHGLLGDSIALRTYYQDTGETPVRRQSAPLWRPFEATVIF
jgi:hypothetical protein